MSQPWKEELLGETIERGILWHQSQSIENFRVLCKPDVLWNNKYSDNKVIPWLFRICFYIYKFEFGKEFVRKNYFVTYRLIFSWLRRSTSCWKNFFYTFTGIKMIFVTRMDKMIDGSMISLLQLGMDLS